MGGEGPFPVMSSYYGYSVDVLTSNKIRIYI